MVRAHRAFSGVNLFPLITPTQLRPPRMDHADEHPARGPGPQQVDDQGSCHWFGVPVTQDPG